MASASCEYLDWRERRFYLYDTFLPTAPDQPGVQAAAGPALAVYAEGHESVGRNFAEWPGLQLVVGLIPETLPDTQSVAFLHIDLRHGAAEAAAVRPFWPRLSEGALMIFDDYGFSGYEGATRVRRPARRGARLRGAHPAPRAGTGDPLAQRPGSGVLRERDCARSRPRLH
jgi:hypothetical protein